MTLALAVAGLLVTRYRLAAVEAERTQLLTWQAQILGQLGRASTSRLTNDRSRPLPAGDAAEALADVIGARDDALGRLAEFKAYQLAAPASSLDARDRQADVRDQSPAKIAQLFHRQSTGAAGDDAEAINHDSQTPWKGWE